MNRPLADEPEELPVALDDVAANELEVLEDFDVLADAAEPLELEAAAAGEKLSFLGPKPMFGANSPETEMESVFFSAEITRWPVLLRYALICALFDLVVSLSALMRSPTVSVPVVVYVVV